MIFVLLNVIIVLLWPLRTSLKFSNYKAYSDEFIVSLNLDRKESVKLYLETWQRERLFEYDEFTGLRESVSIDGEYVNIDIENGRLISNNPKNCENSNSFRNWLLDAVNKIMITFVRLTRLRQSIFIEFITI